MGGGLVDVDGAEIYYERRGSGPTLLLIVGLTGDAGWFEPFAELLAERFTVITYDRRGNSRSPRPITWTSTSIAEQADDAAGLLSKLGLAPAVVFGTSFGAVILLELIVRHSRAIRGAIAHEPAVYSLFPRAQDLPAFWQSRLARGGSRHAMEVWLEMKEDDVIEGLDPKLAQRILGNAEVCLTMELPLLFSDVPNARAVKECRVPVLVAAGEETEMFYFGTSRWLAGQLGTEFHALPGGHGGYHERPKEFATALLPLLDKLC